MDNTGLINPQMSEGLNTYAFEPLQTTTVDFYNPTKSYVDGTVNMVSPEKQASNAGLAYIQGQIESKDYLKDLRLTTPTKTKLAPTLRYQDDSLGGYTHNDPRLEFRYGEAQGIPERVFNTFMQFGGNFLSSYLGSFADIPSAITAVKEGSIDALYNNDLIDGLNSISKYGYDNFQSYDTEFRKDHRFLSGSVLGDIFSSVGYSLGSMAGALSEDVLVGAVTGGLGGMALAGSQLSKLLYKASKIFNGSEQGLNVFRTAIRNGEKIEDAVEKASKFSKLRNGLFAANMLTNGMFEASIEAKETQEQISKKLEQDYFDKNGFTATGSDLKRIQDTVNEATNFTYFTNVALLAVSNQIQFGDLMLKWRLGAEGFEATEKGLARIIAKKGTVDQVEKQAEKEAATTFLGKTKEALSGFTNQALKSSGEMLEEGGQFATQEAALDYYKTKFDKNGITATGDMLKAVSKALNKTVTTEEGWINMIAGLGGGLVSSVVTRAIGLEPTKKSMNERTDSLVELFNDTSVSGSLRNTLLNKVRENIQNVGVRKQANESARVNDAKAAGDILTFNWVNSALDNNQYDLRIEQLENARTLEKEDFEREFGMEFNEKNVSLINDYIDKVKSEAEVIKTYREKIDAAFVNPFINRNSLRKPALEDQLKVSLYDDYKKEMVFQLYKQSINKERYDEIISKLDDDPSNINIEFAVKFATLGELALNGDNMEYEKASKEAGILSVMDNYESRRKELQDRKDKYEKSKSKDGLIPLSSYEDKELNDLNDLLSTFESIAKGIKPGEEFSLEAKAKLLQKANDLENRKTGTKTSRKIGALKAREIITNGYELARIKAHGDKAFDVFEKLSTSEGFEYFEKEVNKYVSKIKKEAKKETDKEKAKKEEPKKPAVVTRPKKTPSGKYINDEADVDTRTMDEVEAYYNFPDKPTDITIKELLTKILNSKSLRPSFRPVIEQMLRSPIANNTIKVYNGKSETLASVKTELNSSTNSYEYTLRYDMSVDSLGVVERSLLHELVHVYTIQGLTVDSNFKKSILPLLEKARTALADPNKKETYYGLQDEYEFVAEALTNSAFQRALSDIPHQGRNLWDNLVNAIMNLLGIKGSSNLLEEVLSLTKIEIQSKGLDKKSPKDVLEKSAIGLSNYAKLDTTDVYNSDELLNAGFFTSFELDALIAANNFDVTDKYPIRVEDNKVVYAAVIKNKSASNSGSGNNQSPNTARFSFTTLGTLQSYNYVLSNLLPKSRLASNPDKVNWNSYLNTIHDMFSKGSSMTEVLEYMDTIALFKGEDEIKSIISKIFYISFNPQANKTKAANILYNTEAILKPYNDELVYYNDFINNVANKSYKEAIEFLTSNASFQAALNNSKKPTPSEIHQKFLQYVSEFAPIFKYVLSDDLYFDNASKSYKYRGKEDPQLAEIINKAIETYPVLTGSVFHYLSTLTYTEGSLGQIALVTMEMTQDYIYSQVNIELAKNPVKPTTPKPPSPSSGNNSSSVRDSLPETQTNTRSAATQILLDYFAEVLGIAKYTEDLNLGKYLGWIKDQSAVLNYDLLQELPNLLNAPKKAYDYITKAKEEIEKRNKNLGGQSKEKSKEYKRLLSIIRKNITINNIESFYSGDELIQKLEDIINAYESSNPSFEQLGLAFNDVKSLLDQIILDDSGFSREEEILNNISFKINPKSFDRFSDKNLRDNSVNLNFISNNGSDVDTLAQELGIEPQDIIDYILKYKNKKPKSNENLHKSKNKLIKVIESLIQGKLDTDVVNGIYNLEITAVNEVDISYDELPLLKEKLAKLKAQKNKGQQPQDSFNVNEFLSNLYVFSSNDNSEKPDGKTLDFTREYAKLGSEGLANKIIMSVSNFTDPYFSNSYKRQQDHIETLNKSSNQSDINRAMSELNKSVIRERNGYKILSLKLSKNRIFGFYNEQNKFIIVGALQSTESYGYIGPDGKFEYFYDLRNPLKYFEVTGMPIETFNDFRNTMETLKALEVEMEAKKKLNKKEFEKFFKLNFSNGALNTTTANEYKNNPTMFKDLISKGVPFANGVKPVFLSIKEIYSVDENGLPVYVRSAPVVIYDKSVSIVDPERLKVDAFVRANIDMIIGLDVRYAAVVKFGDNYEIIATRPTSLNVVSDTQYENILKQIKQRVATSDVNKVGRFSDAERAESKAWNDNFQKQFYIADDNLKFAYYLGVNLKGDVQLRIVNLLTKESGVIKFEGKVLDKINTMDEFILAINRYKNTNLNSKFFDQASDLLPTSFKNYIVDDNIVTVDQLADSLTTSVRGNIRKIKATVTYNTPESDIESEVSATEDDDLQIIDLFGSFGLDANSSVITMGEALQREKDAFGDNTENSTTPSSNPNTGQVNTNNVSISEAAEQLAKNTDIENLFKIKDKAKNLTDSQLDMLVKKHIKQCK